MVTPRLPLIADLSVMENICLPAMVRNDAGLARASGVPAGRLARLGFAHIGEQRPAQLDQLELFVAQFMRALCQPQAALVLDQPESNYGLNSTALEAILAPMQHVYGSCTEWMLAA